MTYVLSRNLLEHTFKIFNECGCGQRECQVLWTSSWQSPDIITNIFHSKHGSHRYNFEVDSSWLNKLWLDLAEMEHGIRFQVHTHPNEAFHSSTDDEFPIIHSTGFLSLVIPDFATGSATLERAFLTRIHEDGNWREVSITKNLKVIE